MQTPRTTQFQTKHNTHNSSHIDLLKLEIIKFLLNLLLHRSPHQFFYVFVHTRPGLLQNLKHNLAVFIKKNRNLLSYFIQPFGPINIRKQDPRRKIINSVFECIFFINHCGCFFQYVFFGILNAFRFPESQKYHENSDPYDGKVEIIHNKRQSEYRNLKRGFKWGVFFLRCYTYLFE